MRTRWKYAENGSEFPMVWKIRDLNKNPMSDAMMTVLAGYHTQAVTIHNKDGSRTLYTAIEYACEGCGSYDHDWASCPENKEEHDEDQFD